VTAGSKRATLRLGLRTLDAVEVLQGLAAGDTVLLGPSPAPGDRVRADTTAAAPRQAPARPVAVPAPR
jgi:HlyD family secretion protein